MKRIIMKKKVTFSLLGIMLILFTTLVNAKESNQKFTSSYTSIAEKDCLTLDSDDLGSIQECESFYNIKVRVIEGDIRQGITLTYKDKEYSLNFQSNVSPFFSTLASKIEWRHEVDNIDNIKGMIVRLDVNDKSDSFDKKTSFLIVTKITEDNICVIGRILPQNRQNEVARKMLEKSKNMPCL